MRTGTDLGVFRSWGEFLIALAFMGLALASLFIVCVALWSLGEQFGHRLIWLPAGAFLAGCCAMRWVKK